MRLIHKLILFVGALALSSPALAVDGVIEINQAKALAGGVTPSDTPGFPVTIDQAGSYRLTGNLMVSNANESGIELTSGFSPVTLDLNGFEVVGPTSCTGIGSAISCTPLGSGVGIEGLPGRGNFAKIRNGTVRGFPDGGVAVSAWSELDGLLVTSNGQTGIKVDGGSQVRNCQSIRNGGAGLDGGPANVLTHNVIFENGSTGISPETSSLIAFNTVYRNGLNGVNGCNACNVVENTIYLNEGDGVDFTVGHGLVRGNTVIDNAGRQLDLNGSVGYRENVINGVQTVNNGADLGGNLCNLGSCP
ncbi:MAG: right-handed parallel beta-helix repeat-containing protein [Myxococcales bacterium]|nr:right-handed parallel beta-helix repeat-containing protein [Myxococcales bacterium]